LIALIAAPLAAQEEGKKKGRRTPAAGGGEAQILKSLEQIDLSAEQKEQVKTILATYKPKLEEVAAAIKITPEQRRAAAEARKAATAEGKKGKQLQEAIQAAMKLSDDQIAARKKQQEVMQALRQEITKVLTAEQQEKFRGKKDAELKKKRKK
jgi:hypothetical protein